MRDMRRLPAFPVVLAGAAAFLELYATQPLLPLLSRTFGASAFHVGLTVTAPTVAVAICSPFVGRLADAVGLRRVIVASAAGLSLVTALAGTSASLNQLIVWRFLQGVLTPGVFAATVAYIHEVWPADRAGRATAAYVSGTVLGGFVGRAVAGVIAADANWHLSFVALAALAGAIAAVLYWRLPPERSRRDAEVSRRSRPPRQPVRHLLRNRRLVAALGVGFCVLFTQVAMFTYVTFHLAAPPFSLSTMALGSLFVVYLVGAAVTPLAGRIVDRYGHRPGIAAAMGLSAIGALLTLAPSLPFIVTGLALCSTGVFMAQATTSSFVGAVMTRDRALAIGMYSSMYYAGGSVGGALPSVFWAHGGWPACVGLVLSVQAAGTALALTRWRHATPQHELLLPDGGG